MSFPAAQEIRILIVDDHALFREGLAELLRKAPDFTVVGECASVAEALARLSSMTPTIVLLDFDLGSERAFAFLESARDAGYAGMTLIITAGVSESEAVQLVQAGVSGIVHKHTTSERLCDSIRRVAGGEVCLEMNYLKPLFRRLDGTRPSEVTKVTDREKKILRMVFQGLGNKQIGANLELSEGAIKAAMRLLFQKLGVQTRAQMVKVALEEYRDQL